ncbi:hypothetical protein B0H13DRAFT_2288179 [Mycena leptocephala]|nr:hypothetical protein B0H13DRAFT_2288179 [Mycena leptocephala]
MEMWPLEPVVYSDLGGGEEKRAAQTNFTRSRALKRRARSALTGKKVTSSSSSPTLGQHHHAWGLCRSSILVDARCVPIKDVTGCPPAIHQQRPDCHSSTRARAHDAPVKRGGRDRAAVDRLCGQAVTLDGGADGGWAVRGESNRKLVRDPSVSVSAAQLPLVLLALPLSLPLSSIGAKLHIGTDTRTTSLAPTPVLNLFALRADARGGDPRARRGTRLGRSRRGGNVRREGRERRLEMRWRVGPKLPTPLRRLHLVHRDASGARPGHCGAFSQDQACGGEATEEVDGRHLGLVGGRRRDMDCEQTKEGDAEGMRARPRRVPVDAVSNTRRVR